MIAAGPANESDGPSKQPDGLPNATNPFCPYYNRISNPNRWNTRTGYNGRWRQQGKVQGNYFGNSKSSDAIQEDKPSTLKETYHGDDTTGRTDDEKPQGASEEQDDRYYHDQFGYHIGTTIIPPVSEARRCRICSATFTSNNKLHAHLRCCRQRKLLPLKSIPNTPITLFAYLEGTPVIEVAPIGGTPVTTTTCMGGIPVIESSAKKEVPNGLAFRSWHFATFQAQLTSDGPKDELCADTGCTMSLIDRAFLHSRTPGVQIKKCDINITVCGIGKRTHQCNKYATVNLLIPGLVNGKPAIASITHQLHLVDDLKARILVGMDVLGPEQAVIDIGRQRLTLPACKQFSTELTIVPKRRQTNRTVLANKLVAVPAHSVAAVPIRLKGVSQLASDQDFLFQPVLQGLNLGPQRGPRAHIIDTNFTFVEVQNATNRTVVIPRKARLGKVLDYKEEGCYAVDASETHLAAGAKWPAINTFSTSDAINEASIAPTQQAEPPHMTEKHPTGFTAYGEQSVRTRLFAVANSYQIWSKTGGFINVPENEWMPIPLKPGAQPKGAKVYRLGPEDQKLIDETFDLLHEQGKIEWSKEPTQFGAPVFVIWKTLPLGERKGRVVTDIRELNGMVLANTYPMPLQTQVIALVAGSRYITVVDAAAFFYQFRVARNDRQKLTVISHRGQEYFNVAPMGYCGSGSYAQRRIDIILRGHEAYAKAYIDDIVIFSATFEEHLAHLRTVFELFVIHNVMLNPQKAYLGYPSITLLGQKVNGFGLTSATEKIAAISNWQFPRNLKLLESYLEFTNWLRDYIPYYAQKIEPLQRRKTLLLQASPAAKGRARRSYSTRALLDEPLEAERTAFEVIQKEFQRHTFLTHFDPKRQLYIDIDASKERGFGAMVYHLKSGDRARPTAIDPILFLSKCVSAAESRYWPTELEMAGVVWTVQKVHHMIRAAHSPTIIWTDHSAIPSIANQTKLSSSNVDKLNLQLIQASTYLSQFNIFIKHKAGREHIIPDALSRLPTGTKTDVQQTALTHKRQHSNGRTETETQVYSGTIVELSSTFRAKLLEAYKKNEWSHIWFKLTDEAAEAARLRKKKATTSTSPMTDAVNTAEARTQRRKEKN